MVPALLTASRPSLSPALACAALASSLLHAALLAVPLPAGPGRGAPDGIPALQARLTPAPDQATGEPNIAGAPISSPADAGTLKLLPLEQSTLMLPPAPSAPLRMVQPISVRPRAGGDAGSGFVTAQLLTDPSRLGDLLGRQQTEFPAELSFPVRVNGQIRVRYPAAAIAQGMEGDVVAWVVVDPVGIVEKIEFAEGDALFQDAVSEAIRNALFYPAAIAGKGVSFPIALVFHFALDGSSATPSVAAAPSR